MAWDSCSSLEASGGEPASCEYNGFDHLTNIDLVPAADAGIQARPCGRPRRWSRGPRLLWLLPRQCPVPAPGLLLLSPPSLLSPPLPLQGLL